MKFPAVAVLAAISLSGCVADGFPQLPSIAADGTGNKADERMIGGIIGAGLIMRDIGADLPRSAQVKAIDAEYRALESTPAGEVLSWHDERSGISGTVLVSQPYRVGSQDCRSYTHRVSASAGERSVRGTACRNPDGSWTLLD